MAVPNGYALPTGATNLHQYSESPAPQPGQVPKDPAVHLRTYQACIPCRKRKVRCDLGSVDSPHEPPCKRCSRESKDCYFSATRRKKKNGTGDGSGVDADDDAFEVKNGRKRQRASTQEEDDDVDGDQDQPRTPGGSVGRTQPLRRPQAQRPVSYTEEDAKASEKTTGILQGAEIHSGHDALKVLWEAAQIRDRLNSRELMERTELRTTSPFDLPPVFSPVQDRLRPTSFPNAPLMTHDMLRSNSRTAHGSVAGSLPSERAAMAGALKAWSRFRFVREGWFTAKEAIEYIKYFYSKLGPLTPVALPDFRPLETHEKMLNEEPMLVITMLLIASRHMKIKGPGMMSRPYEIHGRLWKYLQNMINRVVWGQEQFGGGFCGAGSEPASDVNPLTRKGLRTLGTVESLVLLTEWHPRMMHFPPDEADSELMMPSEAPGTPGMLADDVDDDDAPKGIGGQRMETWLEPCWRSDRMCWMLLGMAMSLAFEIGVFDESDWDRHFRNGAQLSTTAVQTYEKRRASVRDLLLVYVTQTSGRLGLTTVLPSNYSKPEDSELFQRNTGQSLTLQETVMHFWLRMAAIIREGNSKMFANKAFTRDLIKNGKYKQVIEEMQQPLAKWLADFDRTLSMPKHMRCILMIEYEYCRVYMNALALQAVAERCANNANAVQIFQSPQETVRSTMTTNRLPTDAPIAPQMLAKWLGGDRKYMTAVGDASRNVLKIVVDGLYPGEYLRHAPVRTYFRIISVAMMMLKSFSLGASETDVNDSLVLMDRTVQCLRDCIVDDVHVASRFADLLGALSESLKPRLVRIPGDGRIGRSRHISQQSTPVPVSAPLTGAGQSTQAQYTYNQTIPGAAVPNAQQWDYNNLNGNNTTAESFANPLYGISNDIYDLTGNDYSVMPPPNYLQSPANVSMNGSSNGHATGAYDPVYNTYNPNTNTDQAREDWFALPLDSLINHHGGEVNQTMYGPQIGGADMLELLLNGGNGGQNGFS